MRRRTVPNTISKRFRRKLRRCPPEKQFMLWLRCKRPDVYDRLGSLLAYRFIQTIVNIDPFKTPFLSQLPKVPSSHVFMQWHLDPLVPVPLPQTELFIDKEMFPDA